MREILFRAKHIHTFNSNSYLDGQWVEGFLSAENYINDGVSDVLIDPSTICQYTGLTDKNGNKIWENDVVYIPYERLEDSYCKVVFRRGGFIGEMEDGCEDCLLNRKTEVIGNIFDNPELLEGE